MASPKLKPFKIRTAERFTGNDEIVEVLPNVEYSQDAGANWKYKLSYGVLKFQTKKGALQYFKRKRGTAKIV
jgi:hypothetical protein